jgi:hypothetical protein
MKCEIWVTNRRRAVMVSSLFTDVAGVMRITTVTASAMLELWA